MSTTIQAALLATALASGFWYLLLYAMSKLHESERQELRQEITDLKDEVIDLKARARPFNYELRTDGVNVVVERGRLDVPMPRESVAATPDTIVITDDDYQYPYEEMND